MYVCIVLYSYFSCPASPAVKVYPSSFDEVRFSVRAFEFRTSPGGIVYIHCQVSVCSPTSPQCRVGCAHRHRREVSTEDGGSHLVSGGPYLLVADKGTKFIRCFIGYFPNVARTTTYNNKQCQSPRPYLLVTDKGTKFIQCCIGYLPYMA